MLLPHLSRDTPFCIHANAKYMHQLGFSPIRLHSSYLLLIHVLLEALIQVFPPFEEQRMADEFEPRGKLKRRIVEHRLQSIGSNILGVSDFVQVRLEVDIGFDE